VSIYVFQPLDRDLLIACGDYAPPVVLGAVLETALPPAYVLTEQGVADESSTQARVQSGELIQQSEKGEHFTVTVRVVSADNGVHEEEVVQVDVGFGAQQLQTVATTAVVAPAEVIVYDQQPAAESNAFTDPNFGLPIQSYVAPEPVNVAPQETFYYAPVAEPPPPDPSLYQYFGFDTPEYNTVSTGGYSEPVVEPAPAEEVDPSLYAYFGWST